MVDGTRSWRDMCAYAIVEHESVVVALDLIAQHIAHGEGAWRWDNDP